MAHDDLAQDFMVEMAAILHGKRPPSELELEKKRAMFLEGYIRFAEIFAQSEIGDMEVDITKLALYIYSPEFQYNLAYEINTMDDVYKIIEDDILYGMPIWRFFKCSPKMIDTLEKNFQTEMEEETRKIKEKFICKRCEYLREEFTSLGHYCVCRKKSRGYYDYTKIKKCKNFKEKKD